MFARKKDLEEPQGLDCEPGATFAAGPATMPVGLAGLTKFNWAGGDFSNLE